MTATGVVTATPADVTARRRAGLWFLGAAGTWVLYIVLIATTSADYEEVLAEASEATGVAVNRLPAETLAQIGQDHPWSFLANVVLLAMPAVLVLATRRVAASTGDRWGVRLAWVAAAVWWFYLLLQVGLLADPASLPPLTRDLDVLTVPLVSAGSIVSTAAFTIAAFALRRHGWRPVASVVAALLATTLLVLMAVTTVSSDFDEPVAPIGLFPAELVLGIALVVGTNRR